MKTQKTEASTVGYDTEAIPYVTVTPTDVIETLLTENQQKDKEIQALKARIEFLRTAFTTAFGMKVD